MKNVLTLILTGIFAISAAACAPVAVKPSGEAKQPTAAARTISPAEAKKRLESEQGIVLVDVREASEYAQGHIKNSLLLPLGSIEADAPEKLPDKDAVLFVYCRSGRRSAYAAEQLVKMGYTKVFDLGGILDWPYEVTKD
jgi:rhodanese-related sulfurtransferase